MAIFIYNILSLPIYRPILKSKKTFCFIAAFQMFLILALRDVTMGVDMVNYIGGYEFISELSFTNLLSRLHFFDVADLVYPYSYESGYVVLNWICSHIGLEFHGFMVVCAAINMLSVGMFISKYSSKPVLSYMAFVALGAYEYCFGILRQSLAVCICLWAVPYILKNERIKAFAIIIIAFLFHRTAPLFLAFVWLGNKVISKKTFLKLLVAAGVFAIVAPVVYRYAVIPIVSFFGKSAPTVNFQLNNLFILMVVIAGVIYLFIKFSNFESEINRLSLWALVLSIFIEILGMCNDLFARVVEYYWIFAIILVPNLIATYPDKRMRIFAELGMYVLLTVFMIYSLNGSILVPFKFY